MSSGRDERGRASGGEPTMLLLDEAAVEDRVRRRLLAPAPTDVDALVYDQGYEDDSGASLLRSPGLGGGLRLRVPGPMAGVGVEALTERAAALPARDERTSGRLLGGLRERLQQIEQEDFSGGTEGATELYGAPRDSRPLPLGRGAGGAIGGLGAALGGPRAEELSAKEPPSSAGRMRGLGELERASGRSATPWWAEMPSDNAGARGEGLAPFGPLAGKGPPALDAPSSALRAELDARRPLDGEAPLLQVLDDPRLDQAEPASAPLDAGPRLGRSASGGPPRGAQALADEAPEEERPPKRRWGSLAAAVVLLALSAAAVGWILRRPAPETGVAAAGEAPVAAVAIAVPPADGDEINVVVGDLDVDPLDDATDAPGAGPTEGGLGAAPAPGGAAEAAEAAAGAPAPAGLWDRLVDALAAAFTGGPPAGGGKKKAKIDVEVVELEPKAAAAKPTPGPAEALMGTLYVRTKQSAEVFVDGKLVGEAPGLKLSLEPGWYTVKAVPRGEGFTWTARTRIDADMLREVALDLGQEPPPPLRRKEARRRR